MPHRFDENPSFGTDAPGFGLGSPQRRQRRRARAVRHGLWLFEPVNEIRVHDWMIRRDGLLVPAEPSAGRAEKLSRSGGEVIYVGPDFPLGVCEATFRKMLSEDPALAEMPWRPARVYGTLYVTGRIDVPGLAEMQLDGWHRAIRRAAAPETQPATTA